MPVFVSMSFAILLWSLYPLAAADGLSIMNSWHFIVLTLGISFIGSLTLAIFYLKSKGLLLKAISLQKKITRKYFSIIFLNAVSGVLCHTLFFWALTLSNKAGVSLIYESWPIIALIATPFLMKKTWQSVSFKEFFASIIALLGVTFIIFSDSSVNLFTSNTDLMTSFDYKVIGGYILAFAGGYMCAINVATQATMSEYFQELGDDFAATLVMQIWGRSTSFLLAIILMFAFIEPNVDFVFSWIPSLYVGFGVMVLGTSLYAFTILKAKSPTIHVLYYFVPLLAVFWLWLLGETQINLGLIIGGTIIILSNIYLYFATLSNSKLEKE